MSALYDPFCRTPNCPYPAADATGFCSSCGDDRRRRGTRRETVLQAIVDEAPEWFKSLDADEKLDQAACVLAALGRGFGLGRALLEGFHDYLPFYRESHGLPQIPAGAYADFVEATYDPEPDDYEHSLWVVA